MDGRRCLAGWGRGGPSDWRAGSERGGRGGGWGRWGRGAPPAACTGPGSGAQAQMWPLQPAAHAACAAPLQLIRRRSKPRLPWRQVVGAQLRAGLCGRLLRQQCVGLGRCATVCGSKQIVACPPPPRPLFPRRCCRRTRSAPVRVAPPAQLPASRRAPPGLAGGAGRRLGPPPETREVAGRASIATTTTTTTTAAGGDSNGDRGAPDQRQQQRAPVYHTLPEASQPAPSAPWLPARARTRPVCGRSSKGWPPAARPPAPRQRRWRSSWSGC
jgi:hypothetical protein